MQVWEREALSLLHGGVTSQKHSETSIHLCLQSGSHTLNISELSRNNRQEHPTTSTHGNTLCTQVSSDTEKSESSYTDGGNMKCKMVHRDSPACQCRGHVFNPWSRKMLHATEQLSL